MALCLFVPFLVVLLQGASSRSVVVISENFDSGFGVFENHRPNITGGYWTYRYALGGEQGLVDPRPASGSVSDPVAHLHSKAQFTTAPDMTLVARRFDESNVVGFKAQLFDPFNNVHLEESEFSSFGVTDNWYSSIARIASSGGESRKLCIQGRGSSDTVSSYISDIVLYVDSELTNTTTTEPTTTTTASGNGSTTSSGDGSTTSSSTESTTSSSIESTTSSSTESIMSSTTTSSVDVSTTSSGGDLTTIGQTETTTAATQTTSGGPTPTPTCTVTTDGTSVVFLSPNFPDNFPAGARCTETIRIAGALKVKATFNLFHVPSPLDPTCQEGHVSLTSGFFEEKFCGYQDGITRIYNTSTVEASFVATDLADFITDSQFKITFIAN